MIASKDSKTIVEEYSRFLARPDVLGASFLVENGTFLGGINVDQIEQISEFIGGMEFEVREKFVSSLNTYMVSISNFFRANGIEKCSEVCRE